MDTILVIVHLFLAIGLIGLILIQHGKGADAGAAFGSGASATVFGASGSANFLSRATGVLAMLFFVTSLALAWYSMNAGKDTVGLMTNESTAPAAVETEAPAITPVTSDVPELPVAAESDIPVPVEEQSEQKADTPAAAQ